MRESLLNCVLAETLNKRAPECYIMVGGRRGYTEPNSFELIFRLLLKITVDWVYQCESYNFLLAPRGLFRITKSNIHPHPYTIPPSISLSQPPSSLFASYPVQRLAVLYCALLGLPPHLSRVDEEVVVFSEKCVCLVPDHEQECVDGQLVSLVCECEPFLLQLRQHSIKPAHYIISACSLVYETLYSYPI